MRAFGGAILFVFLLAPPVAAHDLGLARVDLVERPGNRYELMINLPRVATDGAAMPRLPARCKFDGPPIDLRGQGPAATRFDFVCAKRGLTAADVIVLHWSRNAVYVRVRWGDGTLSGSMVERMGAAIRVELSRFRAGAGSLEDAARKYLVLGVEHILSGIDHLMFVFLLIWLVPGGWRLAKTVTAFTLAHSITLAFATLGVVQAPSGPIEAAIAMSIVFLAAEILRRRPTLDAPA